MNIQGLGSSASLYSTTAKSTVQRQEIPGSVAKSADKVSISDAAKALAARDNSSADTSGKADFTNMTRHELKNWINDQIKSGKMSLDDSTVFVGLTLNGVRTDDMTLGSADENQTRFNYMQILSAGIEGAKSRHASDTDINRLETALLAMQQK